MIVSDNCSEPQLEAIKFALNCLNKIVWACSYDENDEADALEAMVQLEKEFNISYASLISKTPINERTI